MVAESPEHIHLKWSSGRFSLDADLVLGPYEGRLDNEGERVALYDAEGNLVDEVDYRIGFPWPIVGSPVPRGTTGTGASIQLINPGADNEVAGHWRSSPPSPVALNSEVFRNNLPPHARQVRCDPEQPVSGEPVVVTIKVTDTDGVIGVGMGYQVVLAGQYRPARLPVSLGVLQGAPDTEPLKNPGYYDSGQWTHVLMRDDGIGGDGAAGDHVYTAIIPAQPNRTLIRYRFDAMDLLGAGVTAPHADDPSLNFAYYVYDGVPDYEGYSADMLQRLPVHHLLTRSEDMRQALGYGGDQIPQFAGGGANPARFVYNWYGTFVYDGVVYDNIRYRLRGANGALENTAFVPYTLANPADYLLRGVNVIAVQVVNASLSGSSDCFIDVRLTGRSGSTRGSEPAGPLTAGKGKYEIETIWESEELVSFEPETTIPASVVEAGRTYRVRCRVKDDTGHWSHWSLPVQFQANEPVSAGILEDLRVTEVMYNPADAPPGVTFDNDEFEFIELKNTGDAILDLSHVSFVDGVTFDFAAGAIVSLPPGEFLLVVRNRDAFELRYGAELAGAIAGQYAGKLANGGENVKLVDFWDGTIAEFEYNDGPGWPQQADGEGHSLIPLDSALPGEPTGSLNDAGNWRASTEIGGSPGRDDLLPMGDF